MSHRMEGICDFEVHGGDYSESVEVFHESYITVCKEMFEDMGWGEWRSLVCVCVNKIIFGV
jgi:hypothetical protein